MFIHKINIFVIKKALGDRNAGVSLFYANLPLTPKCILQNPKEGTGRNSLHQVLKKLEERKPALLWNILGAVGKRR